MENEHHAILATDQRWSTSLTVWVSTRRRHTLAVAFAHSGDGALWLALVVLVWTVGNVRLAVEIGAAVLICGAIIGALKVIFRRKRPAGQAGHLYWRFDEHSFPSGHAARVAALAMTLGQLWPLALPVLLGWAALVSLARVALGVHYLSDILVGLFIGISLGILLSVGV